MKKLLLFVCLACLAGQSFGQLTQIRVLSKSASSTTLQIDFAPVQKKAVNTSRGTAYIYSVDQGTPWLMEGAPDLPKVAIPLQIPQKGSSYVEVIEEVSTTIEGVLVAPSKGNLKRTVDPESVPYTFGSIYNTNDLFPVSASILQSPFILRDARGQTLWASPLQYNPVSQSLRSITSMTVVVYHTAESGTNERIGVSRRRPSTTFDQLYAHLFVNYEESLLTPIRSAATPEKMLVIIKDELVDGIQPLVDWKRRMGIETEVVLISQLGGLTPSDVFNFVKNYYETKGITYLLLVADEVALPPMLRPGSPYSCDNCLGYMEGEDHFPEILVGRFHASDADQLKTMVQRNLDYEVAPPSDPTNDWYSTGMASCSNEGAGIGDDSQADYEHSNEWKAKHLADGYATYWEFYDGTHGDISPTPGALSADQPGDPVNTSLVQLMNGNGVSLYNYTGHGWEQGLASGNFNTDAAAALRNEHRYPVIIAVACCAGNYTNGECLGEALQRAGDPAAEKAWGSIAAYMSSDFQSWAPPMEGQDGMNQYLTDADGVSITPVIGAMATYGNALMIAAYGQGGEDMADVWNPFCDPSFVVRTRFPQILTANHPAGLPVGISSLNVSCDVEGALISLLWEGTVLAVAKVENGIAALQFPSISTVGTLSVTGTQFNYIPYQGAINIVPPSGPFLITQSLVIQDPTGNNNGFADYGETIQLNLSLSNVGDAIATGASVTLVSVDPMVNITDNEAILGDVEDSTSVNVPAAFALEVKNDVPDGYVVPLSLEITYSNGITATAPYPITLRAPKFVIQSLTIAEDTNSDLDGQFESGENLIITIKTKNTGKSASISALATLLTASPYLSIAPNNAGVFEAGESKEVVFNALIDPAATKGHTVLFDYNIVAGAYDANTQQDILINPIVDNFESQGFNEYPWQMADAKPWVITTANPNNGLYCSRSGSITHGQKSTMRMNLDILEAGDVSFAYRINSEAGHDYLRFYVDSIQIEQWSGVQSNWATFTYPLTIGQHTLAWSYEKDGFGSVQPDRAFVDDVALPNYVALVSGVFTQAGTSRMESAVVPNPSNGTTALLVDLTEGSELSYQLTDVTGKQIAQLAPQYMGAGRHRIQLPLTGAVAGVYFVKVSDKTGVFTHRIVVQ